MLILSVFQETEGPQLWEINLDENSTLACISRGCAYKWTKPMVANAASFWGGDDEFVVCADLKGTLIV